MPTPQEEAAYAIYGELPDPTLYDPAISEGEGRANTLLDELLNQKAENPQQALGMTIAAALPVGIAALFGGANEAMLGAGGAAKALAMEQERQDALRKEERQSKLLEYQAAQQGVDSKLKLRSEAAKQRQQMIGKAAEPTLALAKEELLQPLKLEQRRAGRANINVNAAPKTTVVPPEIIDATLKASGLPDAERSGLVQQLVAKGATLNDLPNIEAGAKAVAAGRFGESPIIKPISGQAPTDAQQKKASAIAQYAPSMMMKLNRLQEVFATPGFDETTVKGDLAGEAVQLIDGILLDQAQMTNRGAALSIYEINLLKNMRGAITAADGPKALLSGYVRNALGRDPRAGLERFKKNLTSDVRLGLMQNNYELRMENPEIASIFQMKEKEGGESSDYKIVYKDGKAIGRVKK